MLHTLFRLVRRRRSFLILFFTAALCVLNGCKEEKLAKYVFLFVGDGVSYAQRHIAELSGGETLLSNRLPVQASATTASISSALTDSAAAATALATGEKVAQGVLSMDVETDTPFPLITTLAANNGYNVGLLTTATLDDATPAAFYAHAPKRYSYYDIAVQVPESGLRLMVGASFKRPKSLNRPDLDTVLKQGGYRLFSPAKDNTSFPSGKVIATYRTIPFAIDARENAPTLASFVRKAIAQMGTEKGFFMVVEGAKIDVAAHLHDAGALIREMQAFDDALKEAYDFYLKHPDETLIVVTGDHETGGLTLGAYDAENIDLSVYENQKISLQAFKYNISRFRARHPSGAILEDFMPTLEKYFGLRLLSAQDRKELRQKARKGDEEAAAALKMALTSSETSLLREAFRYSMMPAAKRPKTEAYLDRYGKNDPLQIAPALILAQRAGVGFSTFGHTAVPVPVSSIGNGAYFFTGTFPLTAIFGKLLTAMGIPVPAAPSATAENPETPAAETGEASPAAPAKEK